MKDVRPTWQEYNDVIAKQIVDDDISKFTNWDVIRLTMFCFPPASVLQHLQCLADWDRWKDAIVESPVGEPEPYKSYPQSSGNLIAQAYHLSHFLLRTKCNLKSLKTIYEFGAGYGCMCRLIYNLGFSGKYVIKDLPALLELQRYYLGATTNNRDIEFLSKETDFVKQISEEWDNLFIAMWSLSEVAVEFRERILRAVCSGTKYIFLIYQTVYENFDNKMFFSDFVRTITNYHWDCFSVPFWDWNGYGTHYYLFGERIEK